MNKIKEIIGRGVIVRGDDIDTDRIVPARFLKEITFENMGKYAFYDERLDAMENKKQHPFDDEKFHGASILVVNKNFGCGSSREHAPQALMRYGIKAIIGESFADIFSGNCTMLGIPVFTASHGLVDDLMHFIENNPKYDIKLDIEKKALIYKWDIFDVDMKETSRASLSDGTWDSVSLMLDNADKIFKAANKIPYLDNFEVEK